MWYIMPYRQDSGSHRMEIDSSWSMKLYDSNALVGRKREYENIDTTLEHESVVYVWSAAGIDEC